MSRFPMKHALPLCLALAAVLAASPAVAAPCSPSPTTLCFDRAPGDSRFAVHVTWDTTLNGGSSGDAHAVPLDEVGITRGGLFWFFQADNPEVLVKVIDGCASNNHAWVYYSAGTNAGFTVNVTDTSFPNHVWSRTNPDLHVAESVADIEAITCDGSEPDPDDEPWILTTRPGTFFSPDAQNGFLQIDIPVDADEVFYKIVVEVEVHMDGWNADPLAKHNLFSIWRGDSVARNLFGELGVYPPGVGELEGVSNADTNHNEYRSVFHDLQPNGVYSFLYVYDATTHKIKTTVYEGTHVGENRILTMVGDATANYPITPRDSGFHISFGSHGNDGVGGNQVPTPGWVYKNLKVYLERPLD